MTTPSARRYFSERNGRGPVVEPLPFEQFRPLVIHVFDVMRERDYFHQAFGYDCVDAGHVDGELGSNPAAHFQKLILRTGVWPYWREPTPYSGGYGSYGAASPPPPDPGHPWEQWDEDTLFDVVEVLYDLVARGTDGKYHDYNDCGWHYGEFDAGAARTEYRDEMNVVLRLHDPPYELTEAGEVVLAGPADLHPLLEAPLPPSAEPEAVDRVIAAVAEYRARGASLDARRRAVRDLADALEFVRKDVKVALLKKDEQALYHVANGFSIRHLNREQQGDYDGATWYSWMFYVYLATIHAVLRVRDRQQRNA